MKYVVLDCFAIGTDTSVTIAGNGIGLKNGIKIKTDKGSIFEVLSVAMYSGLQVDADNTTTILVNGNFNAEWFEIVYNHYS